MSKELEALERMGCATLEEDLSVRDIYENEYDIVKNAIYRLEAIDNANPSEALECLDRICKVSKEEVNIDIGWVFKNEFNTIKQALLKAQEPKHYLKWEDLEFNHTPKVIDVKMNGNKYKLVVGYNVVGKNLAILRDDKQQYFFLEYDKQFFNDLHLERVEE